MLHIFLIAITANTVNDSFKDIVQQQQEKKLQEQAGATRKI